MPNLTELLVSYGGVFGLILVAFSEASFFPIPPDALLIPLSLAAPGRAPGYALLTTVASSLGGVFGYYLGRRFGRPLLARLAKGELIVRVESLFARYEGWAIGVAGLTPIPYKLATIAAGVFRTRLSVLFLASLLSRGLRFGLEAAAILALGKRAPLFLNRYLGPLSFALVGVGILFFFLGRRFRLWRRLQDLWLQLQQRLARLSPYITAVGPRQLFLFTCGTLAVAFLFLYLKLAEEIAEQELQAFDTQLSLLIQSLRTPALTSFFRFFTFWGTPAGVTLLTLVLVALGMRRKYRPYRSLVFPVVTVLSGWALNLGLKALMARPRPPQPMFAEHGYSLPSGHAMLLTIVGGLFLFQLWPRLSRHGRLTATLAVAICVFVIGLSRIYFGVHYPSDILAGFLAGGWWLATALLVWRLGSK